jgi:hypothetical protein
MAVRDKVRQQVNQKGVWAAIGGCAQCGLNLNDWLASVGANQPQSRRPPEGLLPPAAFLCRVTETGFSPPQAAGCRPKRSGVSWLQPQVPARLPVLPACARRAQRTRAPCQRNRVARGSTVSPSFGEQHEGRGTGARRLSQSVFAVTLAGRCLPRPVGPGRPFVPEAAGMHALPESSFQTVSARICGASAPAECQVLSWIISECQIYFDINPER